MKSFSQFIVEVFNRPAKWEWVDAGPYLKVAEFVTTGGLKYAVRFADYEDGYWSLTFSIEQEDLKSMRVSGTGDQFEVMATVIDVLNRFIAQVKPTQITLSADPDEPSRVKLYRRFVRYAQNKIPGYRMSEPETDDRVVHYDIDKTED